MTEKETRCLGILSAKCPVFIGLLRTDYAKLFLYDPYVVMGMEDKPDFTLNLKQHFLRGYRRGNRIEAGWLKEIQPFLKLPEIDL